MQNNSSFQNDSPSFITGQHVEYKLPHIQLCRVSSDVEMNIDSGVGRLCGWEEVFGAAAAAFVSRMHGQQVLPKNHPQTVDKVVHLIVPRRIRGDFV